MRGICYSFHGSGTPPGAEPPLRVLLEKRHAGLKGQSGTEKLTLRDAPANVFLAPPHIRPAKNDALTFPKTVKGLVRSITKEKPNPNNLRHPSTL